MQPVESSSHHNGKADYKTIKWCSVNFCTLSGSCRKRMDRASGFHFAAAIKKQGSHDLPNDELEEETTGLSPSNAWCY